MNSHNLDLPRQLSQRLAELSTSPDMESGVIDVPVEIMIEMPMEDLELVGLDAATIFSGPLDSSGRLGFAVAGSRAIQLLLAQLLRGGLLENALAEFMSDIVNSSFLDAEPDFVPAEKADIQNIPLVKVTKEHLNSDSVGEDMKMCAICRESFEEGLQVMRLPCRHLFCEECVRPWLEKSRTCPLCREEIVNILPTGEKQRPLPIQSTAKQALPSHVPTSTFPTHHTSVQSESAQTAFPQQLYQPLPSYYSSQYASSPTHPHQPSHQPASVWRYPSHSSTAYTTMDQTRSIPQSAVQHHGHYVRHPSHTPAPMNAMPSRLPNSDYVPHTSVSGGAYGYNYERMVRPPPPFSSPYNSYFPQPPYVSPSYQTPPYRMGYSSSYPMHPSHGPSYY